MINMKMLLQRIGLYRKIGLGKGEDGKQLFKRVNAHLPYFNIFVVKYWDLLTVTFGLSVLLCIRNC